MSKRIEGAGRVSLDEVQKRCQQHLERLGLKELDLEAHLRWAKENKVNEVENLEQFLATAVALKRQRSLESRFERSGLRVKRTLIGFDWNFQPKLDRRAVEGLFELGFIERNEDVLLTGKTGTGKSHLLQALVLKACEQELQVKYTRCVDLVDDLYSGLADGSYERKMKHWSRQGLLVIDDVGLGQLKRRAEEPTAAHILFNLLDRRHSTASTAISSNIQLSTWGKYLGDALLAAAVLDRLAANAIRIDIDGPSYRQHLARLRSNAAPESAEVLEPS